MGLALLQISNLRIFQELATKAYDMEVTIASCHSHSSGFAKSKKNKGEFKKNSKLSKNLTKEEMSISTNAPIRIMGRPK